MAVNVQYPSSSALIKRCKELQAAAKPDSAALRRAREDFRLIVAEDHYHMMLNGIDYHGNPRAPLAASTLANPNRGPGPSLIPDFWRSRFAYNVRIGWEQRSRGGWVLVKRFVDIMSKPSKNRGAQPFAQYHLEGASKPGTAWMLPQRDVRGVTRAGFKALSLRLHKFAKDMATSLKGRS